MPAKKNKVCMINSKKIKHFIALLFITVALAATPVTNDATTISAHNPAASSPTVAKNTPSWDFIIPFISVLIAITTAYIKLNDGEKKINENSLRSNIVTLDINKHIEQVSNRLEEATKEHAKLKEHQTMINQDLKSSIAELQRELAVAKQKAMYDDKSIEELKIENKEMVRRLEKLISDLMAFISQ